jgi:hypothetical protein
LSWFSRLQTSEGKYIKAVKFAEQSYDCVAVAYKPVLPTLQGAASALIEYLLNTKDFYDAERFGQATLDSLKDPKNGLNHSIKIAKKKEFNDHGVTIIQSRDSSELKFFITPSFTSAWFTKVWCGAYLHRTYIDTSTLWDLWSWSLQWLYNYLSMLLTLCHFL